MGPVKGKSGDEHLADWAALHMTQAPTGFVGGWLRATAAVARRLAGRGVSPDAVTVTALLLAVAAVPLAGVDGWTGAAGACLAVTLSGLADGLDGAVAVQAGRTTKVGFLLDSALDRLADVALVVALAVAADNPVAGELAVAAVGAAWWMEYVRARGALAAEADRQLVTPGERPTRIVLAAVGLALRPLALAALWGQVVIVGGSGLFLFGWSIRRLRRLDQATVILAPPRGDAGPSAPTT